MRRKRNMNQALILMLVNFLVVAIACEESIYSWGIAWLFLVSIAALAISIKAWVSVRKYRSNAAVDAHPIDLDENPVGASYLYQIITQKSWKRMGLPAALLRLVDVGYAHFEYDEKGAAVELVESSLPADDIDRAALSLFQRFAAEGNRFHVSDIADFAHRHRSHYVALCMSWIKAVSSSVMAQDCGFARRVGPRSGCLIALAPILLTASIVFFDSGSNRDTGWAIVGALLIAISLAASIFWGISASEEFRLKRRGRHVLDECLSYAKWLEGKDAKEELAAMRPERLRKLRLWAVALGIEEGAEFPEVDLTSTSEMCGASSLAIGLSIIPFDELWHELDETFTDANDSALGNSDGFSSFADGGGIGGDGGSDSGGGCGGCSGCGGCGGCGG